MTEYQKKGDVVFTPDWVAKDIIEYFKPTGVILDPCRGQGAFHKFMPSGSPYCEITEGIDFLKWTDKVDWCISNPPYSIFRKFFEKGFEVSDNCVWLIPTWKAFSGAGLITSSRKYGGMAHMRHYGTGTKLGWSPLANSISAVYYKRGYKGDISQSWYDWSGK
jgi:hypothetical protein